MNTPFPLLSLQANSDTQFRTEMSKSQIEGLSDLIERNVKWKTPIQIATHYGVHYLTDGFHRVEAYKTLGIGEIPEGQFEIIECETMDDVFMLSIRANAAHGNKNTVEERLLMMNKLIQMDEKRYMPNRWEVSLTAIAEALQIPKGQARTVVQPKNEALKQERNTEIHRLHKEGKSNGEIDSLLNLGKDYTRRFLLKQQDGQKVQDRADALLQDKSKGLEPLNALATSGGVQHEITVILARKDAELARLRLELKLNQEYSEIKAQEQKVLLQLQNAHAKAQSLQGLIGPTFHKSETFDELLAGIRKSAEENLAKMGDTELEIAHANSSESLLVDDTHAAYFSTIRKAIANKATAK